jgi:hypothetical protein
LSNQSVQVLVVRTLNVQVTTANIVDGFIVDHEGAVRVLESGVCCQNGVVRLNNRCSDLRSWVNAEFKLALLSIVYRQALHEECTKSRTGTTTEGVENQETLETRAVVGDTSNLVQDLINKFLSDSVVTTGVVVGSILLSSNHLFRMEQAAVGTSSDLIDNVGLEIAVNGTWDIFSLAL